MGTADWPCLGLGRDTGWSRGAVVANALVEVVVLLGGLGVDCEILVEGLIAPDRVVVVVLAGAAVHVPDRGQHLFFH